MTLSKDDSFLLQKTAVKKKMRAVSFVDRLELDYSGSVFKNAITLGDVDNDGMHEVGGNQNGDVLIFKGTGNKCWRKACDLGMVTAVVIGDVFNKGANSLVVVNGEGWCYIFDLMAENEAEFMKATHVQRIPANAKVLLLHDVNSDGLSNHIYICHKNSIISSSSSQWMKLKSYLIFAYM